MHHSSESVIFQAFILGYTACELFCRYISSNQLKMLKKIFRIPDSIYKGAKPDQDGKEGLRQNILLYIW